MTTENIKEILEKAAQNNQPVALYNTRNQRTWVGYVHFFSQYRDKVGLTMSDAAVPVNVELHDLDSISFAVLLYSIF